MTGDEGKLEALLELLRPIGIQEIVRTGKVAIARGPKSRACGPDAAEPRAASPTTRGSSDSRTDTTRKDTTRPCGKIYYDQDADLGPPQGQEDRHHRLRQPGPRPRAEPAGQRPATCVVGLYKGSKSWTQAEKDGLKVATVAEAAREADVIMILLPDQTQRQVYEEPDRGRPRARARR